MICQTAFPARLTLGFESFTCGFRERASSSAAIVICLVRLVKVYGFEARTLADILHIGSDALTTALHMLVGWVVSSAVFALVEARLVGVDLEDGVEPPATSAAPLLRFRLGAGKVEIDWAGLRGSAPGS